jgi:hypothetical protein
VSDSLALAETESTASAGAFFICGVAGARGSPAIAGL